MPTTADYLTQLERDRDNLADNLVTMGVEASQSETFTSLVPKVLDISGGGGASEDGSIFHPFVCKMDLNLRVKEVTV